MPSQSEWRAHVQAQACSGGRAAHANMAEVYMHVCACTCACVHVHLHVRAYVRVCTCTCACAWACVMLHY